MQSFNEVQTKPGSEVIMKFDDWPLLVTGHYGQGRTVAFMGYTPSGQEVKPAWMALYGEMLMAAKGENPQYRYAAVATDKPIMELLKEQPMADVAASPRAIDVAVKQNVGNFAVELANGARFARLVRLRIEWADPNHQPYAVLYDDNYFDLFPGEKKRVAVEFRTPEPFDESMAGTLIVEGTNAPPTRVPIHIIKAH